MPDIPEGHFLAHYYIETQDDLRKTAEWIASEETTGSWVGGGSPTELFKCSRGWVYEVEEIEKGKGRAWVAFPLSNLQLDENMFPSIWLFMTGGPLFERPFCDKVRLLDFSLPEEMLNKFPGPKFGMKGTRDILGVDNSHLVIATIIKPCAGLTAQEVADKCYQAALGGVDFIKDDEKMNNPDYCPLTAKVRLVTAALKMAEEETGKKVIYCPHISTRPDKILDAARVAIDNGATGLMLNFFATGFYGVQMLAEHPDVSVPLYVHSGGRTAWSRFPGYGVDLKVVARWIRLLGGDYFRAHMLGGYMLIGDMAENQGLVDVLREKMGNIKDTVPALSGGLHAGNLVANLEAYGMDILPMAGGAIIDHPLGIEAGVLALRQAAESYQKGISLEEYAKNHPELSAALVKNGIYRG